MHFNKEPVSGSRPRFSSELGGHLERSSLVPFSLTCQAQGYPVPVFRWIISRLILLRLPFVKEPVSGSRPRFSTELKGGNLERSSLAPFCLTCQAQGYPVPVFRFVILPWSKIRHFVSKTEPSGSVKPRFSTAAHSTSLLHSNLAALSLFCAAQGFPVPITR
jgi:hypothetical protein